MKAFFRILRFIFTHPLGRKRKFYAFKRFLTWQLGQRLLPFPILYPYIEGSKFLISKELRGATGNVYVGLHEFEEMIFTLHLLRENDIFCDIGANIGSYTLLASKVIGAKTHCFEPVISTYHSLLSNISLNDIADKVLAYNIGLGDEAKKLRFSTGLDTKNHVLIKEENTKFNEVEVNRLDDVISDVPLLMKIDVEGFEYFVLKGSSRILQHQDLKAIIIELNKETERYNVSKAEIHQLLENYGFLAYQYDGFFHSIKKENEHFCDNRIYIRDLEFVTKRCIEARKIKLFNEEI